MINRENISAYILAGGKSSRMGMEKGLVLLNGKTFVQHILSHLKGLFSSVYLNTSCNLYDNYTIDKIPDLYPGRGPLAGIHACLNHCKTEYAFFISCDLPLLSTDSIHEFISRCNFSVDANVVRYNYQVEPLIGLYRKNILPHIELLLKEGKYSVAQALKQWEVNYVDFEKENKKYITELTSINSPLDLNETLEKLKWVN